MKDQFMHEIRELNERLHASELAKEQFEHKQSGRSFLGDFQDDEVERENMREQREQLAMMKEKLQDRVSIKLISRASTLKGLEVIHFSGPIALE